MNGLELLRRVAFHFVMGAILGALFVTLLLVFNVRNLSEVVLNSTSPIAATIILVLGTSLYFAFGAAITGFHFVIADEGHSGSGHR